jgi:hypothetical protein
MRTRPLDCKDGAARRAVPEKGPDPKLRNESCRQVSPCQVRDACGPHDGNEHTRRAIASDVVHSAQVIGPRQANGETRAKAQIDAAAHGHGETVLSGVHARGTGVQADTAEQHLRKGNDEAGFLERNSWAEQIRIHRTVDTARQTAETVSP